MAIPSFLPLRDISSMFLLLLSGAILIFLLITRLLGEW